MKSSPRAAVYCQVYNTEQYLPQCIESVLNQSYSNFQFILIDNASTDHSARVMQKYADLDSRIQIIHMAENTRGIWLQTARKEKNGGYDYITNIDSDDWWEPNYLERLVHLAESEHLDMTSTGCAFHQMSDGATEYRKVEQKLLLDRRLFPAYLPNYHFFLRTNWGILFRAEVFYRAHMEKFLAEKLPYGTDTLASLSVLREAERLGIDDSALYHYRIHSGSQSYRYNPRRFFADIYLYNDAIDFLSAFGPISERNRTFLQRVYSNALTDTTRVIQNSTLSPADKLREYRRIASHPLTQSTYRECREEDAVRSRAMLLQRVLQAGCGLRKESDEDLRMTAQSLLPHCGRAVSAANAELFLEEPRLFQALVQEEPDVLLRDFLSRMENNQGVKKFALPEAIQALSVEHPLLCQITDAVFMRKYGAIYWSVWNGDSLSALEEMTGLLLEDQVSGGRETFLQLYISLGAALEQAPAFVYGKMQLAWLYLRQDRLADCRAAAEELTEMGVENEELAALYRELEARG